MSMNSEIFLPHMNEKHGHNHRNGLCTAMSNDGVWGTDIEILALATIIQAPIYTLSRENSNLYRWLCYLPLSPPGSLQCDCDKTLKKLLYMDKPKDFHLELFHYLQVKTPYHYQHCQKNFLSYNHILTMYAVFHLSSYII